MLGYPSVFLVWVSLSDKSLGSFDGDDSLQFGSSMAVVQGNFVSIASVALHSATVKRLFRAAFLGVVS